MGPLRRPQGLGLAQVDGRTGPAGPPSLCPTYPPSTAQERTKQRYSSFRGCEQTVFKSPKGLAAVGPGFICPGACEFRTRHLRRVTNTDHLLKMTATPDTRNFI